MREKMFIFGDDYDTRDGTGLRDYIHVTDLADAHVKALEYCTENDTRLTVNLGSEKGVTVKEMVEAARKITGRPIPAEITGRRDGDTAVVLASSAYAKEILGWEAKCSDVKTLIKTTWDVYRNKTRLKR
jgi:UDP-glucose 4-epimerase